MQTPLDIDAPLPAPRRLPLLLRLNVMLIVGGRFGKDGVSIKCMSRGVDDDAHGERKAMVENPAHAGVFFVGYGDDDRSAAEDLFSKVKAADIEARKAPKNSARAAHKRQAPRTPTTATLDTRGMDAGGLVLVVSDVLTKNDRYGRGKGGTFEKTASKWFKVAVARAAHAHGFTEPYRIPEIKKGPNKRKASTVYGPNTIQSGLWSLEVLSIWPHQRHLNGAGELANGDADAPLSMVRDAMQRSGIIDDDMRIVSDRTLAIYRKDERRTIARLTRIDGPALQRHHNTIESLLLAELMADNAATPAAC